ncbi:MAG: hypothetical protein M3R36_15280 [Bacteroidota bacterium]|nr:hypothetical protein [Bacteroidota bacterium]
MKIFLITLFIFPLFFPSNIKAQKSSEVSLGKGFSIMPSVNYVSSATIQLNAFSNDLFERSETEALSGGYGYGLTIRKKFFRQDLSFGFTAEYLKIFDGELDQSFGNDSIRVRARVSEELFLIPIEFSGYFNIPDFSEDLRIYLGGGLGVYFGDRKRTVLNIESQTISKDPGFSFVILSGMEILVSKQISGVFEIRFRQAEYSVSSQFPVSTININGTIFPLEKNLNSKVYVDGLKLTLGIAYNF